MKLRDIKKNLKSEEYNIPDVLNKIKDRLNEITIKQPARKSKPTYRFSFGFASLVILLLFVFSAISVPTYNNLSGPTEINYFSSKAEIDSTLQKFNKQKDSYINKSQELIESYSLTDIEIKKVYDANNQIAKTYSDKVFYLNNEGVVVFNTSNDGLVKQYQESLNFDESTNIKTMYIVNKNLIVIYNNKQYINVIKYNIDTMHKLFSYTIASTFVNSYIYNNKLFIVSILNDTILPCIKVNDQIKQKNPTDIGYLENVIGDSYTILTSINLSTNEQKETIFLSFNKWDIAYFNQDNLYLINNHMNYKKNLNYGEYTTIVKFKNIESDGLVYHGSYTIKGSVQDKNNVYENNDDFRIALEVTHYKLKKVFFFFTKITEVEHSINVINLRSTIENGNHILVLTSNYVINETDNLDQSISILSTSFNPDKVVVESRGISTNITVLDFADPLNIKTESIEKNKTIYSNIIPFDDSYGFSIRTIKTATGEFEIRFFDLRGYSPVELTEQYAYLNYTYLLKDSEYIVLEAISHSNSYYINEDENNYYLGFAVSNNFSTDGTYTLIKIDKESKKAKYQDLSSNNIIIEKLISTDTNILYGLSHDNIVKFRLNQYDNYVKNKVLKIN